MSDTVSDIFKISILLIIVVYFVGFTSDVSTISSSTASLINVATGRDASGKFSQYPTTPAK